MRLSTGAILIETRPATIITSAWRGLARKTSAPNLATSLRGSVIAIISMAQQAKPKVAGQSADLRAQLTNESSCVVITSGRTSPILVSNPIVFSIDTVPRAYASGGLCEQTLAYARGTANSDSTQIIPSSKHRCT